ncbi:hypothetical protein LPJ66_006717 [Kickxella alabastrina]|uniref:Uncharacterized protein n=1 Tax=Kickxella alabastrina TaxID=61397 RepID=A0ACC1IBL4_9FUNG|nr:hypothetical protein LPJ66_006717 [Kickxella alabastrina]
MSFFKAAALKMSAATHLPAVAACDQALTSTPKSRVLVRKQRVTRKILEAVTCELVSTRACLDSTSANLTDSHAEVAILRHKLAMACTQLTGAHSEIDLFRAEVASLRGKLASSNAKVEVLQSDLASSHANENILRNELASSRAMVNAKSRENTIALRMAAAAGSLFLSTCARLTTLRGTLSSSRNEAVTLRARLELSTANANNLLETLTSTRTEVVSLRDELS